MRTANILPKLKEIACKLYDLNGTWFQYIFSPWTQGMNIPNLWYITKHVEVLVDQGLHVGTYPVQVRAM